MKIIGALIVAIVLALAAYLIYQSAAPRTGVNTGEPTTSEDVSRPYTSARYGLSFSYPDTYQLTEFDAPGSALREHHVITLIPKKDLPVPQGGEGPPAITIDIYQNNLDKHTTEGWIRGTSESNFKLSSEGRLASTSLDGQAALSYRWSGLYEGTTVAIAQPNWVYAFTVTYLAPGDDIVQDFVNVRNSVRLTPGVTPGSTTTTP